MFVFLLSTMDLITTPDNVMKLECLQIKNDEFAKDFYLQ
jgi:hypothetical protein